jgi:hypothetical protein
MQFAPRSDSSSQCFAPPSIHPYSAGVVNCHDQGLKEKAVNYERMDIGLLLGGLLVQAMLLVYLVSPLFI